MLIMESLSVVILNLLMVIVFAKHRQLQRRDTYLLIRNLAMVDLLAGGISGPLQIESGLIWRTVIYGNWMRRLSDLTGNYV